VILGAQRLPLPSQSLELHTGAGDEIYVELGQGRQNRVLRLKVAEVCLELPLLLAQGLECWAACSVLR
jgi:hypothetical protein